MNVAFGFDLPGLVLPYICNWDCDLDPVRGRLFESRLRSVGVASNICNRNLLLYGKVFDRH